MPVEGGHILNLSQEDADRMVKVIRHRLRNHVSGLKTALDLLESEIRREREDLVEYFPLLRKECMLVDELSCRVGYALEDRVDGGPDRAELVLERVFAGIRKVYPAACINADCSEWNGRIIDHSISMERCFYELMLNAVESSREAAVDVTASVKDGDMIFEAGNSCAPVSDEQFEGMLKPFFTTKSRHVGIGLNIADNALKHTDGRLVIDRLDGAAGVVVKAIFKAL